MEEKVTQLYLIRHGIAADREAYRQDQERPLTSKGSHKTGQVAKQLKNKGLHFDLILTSPLVRARETAVILQQAGLSDQIEELSSLAPEGDIHHWLDWLESDWENVSRKHSEQCLAMVGHQPDLGNWAETLAWGEAQEKIVLKKAGVIGLNLPKTGTPVGKSELFLLISPKWML